MSQPEVRLFPVKRHDTWSADELTLREGEDSDPVDLTGAAIRFTMRDRPGGRIYLELDNGDVGGIEMISAVGGSFRRMSRVLDVPALDYYWEYQITFADGRVETYPGFDDSGRVVYGRLKVHEDVVR